MWRSAQAGSGDIRPEETIGLTIAGVHRCDPDTGGRLANIVGDLAEQEAQLPRDPYKPTYQTVDLLGIVSSHIGTPDGMMSTRTASEIIRHEPGLAVLVQGEPDRAEYQVTLGGSSWAPYRGVHDVASYLDAIATLDPESRPGKPDSPVQSDSSTQQPAPTGASSVTEQQPHKPKTRFQIFVSSTYTDLIDERQAVNQALLSMGKCIPAGMELFAGSSKPPWNLITQALDDTDYLILILGSRYGDIAPGEKLSYTEREYEYARSLDIPVIPFLSTTDRLVLPDTMDTYEGAAELREVPGTNEEVSLPQVVED